MPVRGTAGRIDRGHASPADGEALLQYYFIYNLFMSLLRHPLFRFFWSFIVSVSSKPSQPMGMNHPFFVHMSQCENSHGIMLREVSGVFRFRELAREALYLADPRGWRLKIPTR